MAFLINASYGGDNTERASVAMIIANAAAGKGEARVFLTHGALDLAVAGKADGWQAPGYPPMDKLLSAYREKGGILWVCKACADAKGITQDDLAENAVIAGAADTMSFLEAGGKVLA